MTSPTLLRLYSQDTLSALLLTALTKAWSEKANEDGGQDWPHRSPEAPLAHALTWVLVTGEIVLWLCLATALWARL